MLMDAARSALLVVDIQERLLPVIDQGDRVVANTRLLLRAAGRLGVPVLVSEQYPRGLGATVAEIAEPAVAAGGVSVEKMTFSCVRDPDWKARLADLGRSQLVVCGMEAHVCVLQTVLDLLAGGAEVFVVADAVSSRAPANRDLALNRMAAAGARVASTEMVAFEWLERAGTPAFREISALIR